MRAYLLAALALCLCGLPAAAGNVLFSDLGPSGDVYSVTGAWNIQGSSADPTGNPSNDWPSSTIASPFGVAGLGSEVVNEIDLPVWGDPLVTSWTFYASIWSDDSGVPGAQVPNAYWSLLALEPSASYPNITCCALMAVTNISGVTLTGGAEYYLILGPLSVTDDSETFLLGNNTGVTGDVLYSENGGTTWVDNGPQNSGAFDVLGGTPEPSSFALIAAGIGLLGFHRSRHFRG